MHKDKSQLVMKKIFDDPTPNGIINQRLIHHLITVLKDYADIKDDDGRKFFEMLILIGKKLAAVWSHYHDYLSIEDRLIEAARKNPITQEKKIVQIDYSQELFFHFDEFLVQVKSCLDYLVKVPTVILGHSKWNLRTFGAKGNDVIKAIKNNVRGDYANMGKAVIYIIRQNQPWLEMTIEARDKINHFLNGGINFEFFTVQLIKNSEREQLRVPMWSNEQSIRQFMEIVWNNLFRFCEAFVVSWITFRLKKEFVFFHDAYDINSVKSPWTVITQKDMEAIINKLGRKTIE